MIRSTKLVALAGAGAVALALAAPTVALADDSAPTFSRSGAADVDSDFYAGYTASFKKKMTVEGTIKLPKLGDCATDAGILIAIETSDASGGDYIDAGAYSSCSGGAPTHSVIIESAAQGQILLEDGNDGDVIKVTQVVNDDGSVDVTLENKTAGTSYTETVVGANIEVATGLHWGQIYLGGTPVPTLDIGKSKVKDMKVGGKPLKKAKPTKYDFAPGGDLILKTGKIKKKDSYTVKYVG